jgi:hypothetical protein
MRDGTMDPEGEGSTRAGWVCGIIGTCWNAFVVLACGGVIGAWYFSFQQASKNVRPTAPRMAPAPAPMPPQVPPPGPAPAPVPGDVK